MNDSLRALAHVKRVLVLHDLHPDADNAAWRAGLLARPQGGWLRLLHASRLRSPEAARQRLAPLAWRLQEHLQVAVLAQAFRGSAADELRRAAQDADLVVLPCGASTSLARRFLALTAVDTLLLPSAPQARSQETRPAAGASLGGALLLARGDFPATGGRP